MKYLIAVMFTIMSVSVYGGVDSKEIINYNPPTDAGYYVAIEGGAFLNNYVGQSQPSTTQTVIKPKSCYNYNHENRTTATTTTPNNLGSGFGGVAGIKGGYNFESYGTGLGFRLQPAVELEGLYLGNSDYNAGAVFVNGVLRFKNDSIVTPYIGVGVGGEYLTGLPGGSSLDPAVQALIGASVKIDRHWSVFTEYHFIDAFGTDTGAFKASQIQQHVFLAGVGYSF